MRIEGLNRSYMTPAALALLEPHQGKGPAEVLYVHLEPVGANILHIFPNLRAIACPCTGTDHIDVEGTDLRVISLAGWENLWSLRGVSEWTIKLMIDCLRHGGQPHRGLPPARTLAGSVVAIIGYGRIGRHVGEVLTTMGARVLIDSPIGADVITLHLPLTNQTRGIVNQSWLSKCKPGAVLINTARPQLVVWSDVRDALDAGLLAWYAADFYDCSTWHPRAIRTPHVAGWTTDLAAAEVYIAERIVDFLNATGGSNPTV